MNTVISNNTKIFYRIKKNKGKTLVFLHGVGRNYTSWKHFYKHFEGLNYTTITPDLRGCGNSRTNKISMQSYAKDLNKILEKEKIKKVILVGHCLGTSIAIKFNELFPDKVDKMFLMGIFTKKTIKFYPIIRSLNNLAYYSIAFLHLLGIKRKKFIHIDYSKYQNEPLLFFPLIDFKGVSVYNWLLSVKVLLDYNPSLNIKANHINIFAGKDYFVKHKGIKNSKVIKELDHVMVIRKPKVLFETLENYIKNG